MDPETVTAEEVREFFKANQIDWWSFHSCSICFTPVGYKVNPLFFTDEVPENEAEIGYDSRCDCTSYPSPLNFDLGWDDIAEFLRRNPTSEDTIKLCQRAKVEA